MATDGPLSRRYRIGLAAILIAGCAVRVAYLRIALGTPGYVWEDPDGYARQAVRLVAGGGWRWTFDAVTYSIQGQQHALPPLYSIFLSVFAALPGFPLSAQVAQILLAVVCIVLLFDLGRVMHSVTCGLIAAGAFAIWIPNVFSVWSTSQESLYIPLILLAFVVYARAIVSDGSPLAFAVAGLIFGAAALARSMPLFFMLPAAAAHIAPTRRRRTIVQAAALVIAFVIVVAPYSALLSRHFGQLTVIDSHGSIHFESTEGNRAPGVSATARALWHTVAERPREFLSECAARARSLLHVNGGRLLQIYVVARNKTRAAAWKLAVHAGSDALIVASVSLAPFGIVLSRQPRVALVLALWAIVNVAIASLGGFGGARLRAPFEPLLFVLSGAVVAGAWRRAERGWLVVSGVVAAFLAAVVLQQVPRSIDAWPDYGIQWPSIFARQTGQFTGAAGLNVPVIDGVMGVTVAMIADEAQRDAPVEIRVRVAGVPLRTTQILSRAPLLIRVLSSQPGLGFLELEATGVTNAAMRPRIRVEVQGR